MSNLIIGLIGKKRSGKDSFASVLVERYGYKRVAYADPLREALLRMDPCVDWDMDDDGDITPYQLSEVVGWIGWERAKDIVPDVRRLLQSFGTDAIREIDEDFWVRAGAKQIDETPGPVVVTDVRFPNEADAIRKRGGLLVRITRPGYDGDGHPTETALDDYRADMEVSNTKDLERLYEVANSVGRDAPAMLGMLPY